MTTLALCAALAPCAVAEAQALGAGEASEDAMPVEAGLEATSSTTRDPVGAPTVVGPGQASVSALGEPGESCRARADCAAGLHCVANVCRDEREGNTCASASECGPHLRCVAQVCESRWAGALARADLDEDVGATEPQDHYVGLRNTYGLVGGSVMGGPALFGGLQGTFLFAGRAGLVVNRNELALEVAPFTQVYGSFQLPVFQLSASYGYLIPVVERRHFALYWPVRIGLGFITGNTGGKVLLEGRADVLGIAMQFDQLLIDLHFPSFRVAWSPGGSVSWGYYSGGQILFHWLGGVSFSYTF